MDDQKYWEAINRIMTHEAMCEERSKTIFNRLENIESQLACINKNMFLLGITLISGMAGVIFTLLTR
jgi:hypothetical protein